MSSTTVARWRAAVLVIAPVVMLAALLSHPHIGNPIDPDVADRIAAAVAAEPGLWAMAHLLVAVGSGLILLALLAVRGWLREESEDRWSGPAVPFVVLGSVFYAMPPAMELAPLAASAAGVDAAAVQGALFTWFFPVILTSAAIFFLGALGFAAGIARSGVLDARLGWFVAVALVVMAAARFVPLTLVQFHVQGVAGLVAFCPLAYVAWARSTAPASRSTAPGTASGATTPDPTTSRPLAGGSRQ